MIHKIDNVGNVELQSELARALTGIDDAIMGDGTKETLEVNRPKRVVPHYPFVPSLTHPEPFGSENYSKARVHKPSGKKRDSRKKGK